MTLWRSTAMDWHLLPATDLYQVLDDLAALRRRLDPAVTGDCVAVDIRQGCQPDRVGLCRIGMNYIRQLAHADSGAHDNGHFVDHFAGARGHDGGAYDRVGPFSYVDLHKTVVLPVGDRAIDILH